MVGGWNREQKGPPRLQEGRRGVVLEGQTHVPVVAALQDLHSRALTICRIGTRGSVDNLLNGAAPIPEVFKARAPYDWLERHPWRRRFGGTQDGAGFHLAFTFPSGLSRIL